MKFPLLILFSLLTLSPAFAQKEKKVKLTKQEKRQHAEYNRLVQYSIDYRTTVIVDDTIFNEGHKLAIIKGSDIFLSDGVCHVYSLDGDEVLMVKLNSNNILSLEYVFYNVEDTSVSAFPVHHPAKATVARYIARYELLKDGALSPEKVQLFRERFPEPK